MPGRTFSSESYRYGFNGKENDNEIKGTGNQQDYGMRIYDTRLARFLSVDPLGKEYPNFTPYQYAGNSPIGAIDLDGMEGWELSTPLGTLRREADAKLARLQNGVSSTSSNSSQSTGMNLGALKMQKKSYSGTSWIFTANPENTKTATFANNSAVSAWNQGVSAVEFASKSFTKKGRREQDKIVAKTIWKGIIWLATTDVDEKLEDVSNAFSDVDNWENASGSVLLYRGTNAAFSNLMEIQPLNRSPLNTKKFEGPGAAPRLKYEKAEYHGKVDNLHKSRAPINGQEALDYSIQVKATSPRRVGIDYEAKEFVVFDQTRDGIFHGHVREWKDLHIDMQNTLIKAGMADSKGAILTGSQNEISKHRSDK